MRRFVGTSPLAVSAVRVANYTQGDSRRVEAFRDGDICAQWQVVCFCFIRIGQLRRKRKAKFVPWERMVHGASVQKSTVFALAMRGPFKKLVVSAVRRGVCNV